jgi:hypothetical protein
LARGRENISILDTMSRICDTVKCDAVVGVNVGGSELREGCKKKEREKRKFNNVGK